ncbi:DUF2332 domain-containing protein [Aquidulcibacter sp.]|jgi:hypothetical protein|uniref:DUF2332 domain-containing protein n=1 Tax=Aquidulcibacter sp. TaxID=2052990 RepID=UPI003BA5A2DA
MVDVGVPQALRQQAIWCKAFDSPFTAELCETMADDFEAGGIIADLTGGWITHPVQDALALRLAGALHAIALTEPEGRLAQVWPQQGRAWSMAEAWPVAVESLRAREHWVRDFLKSPPQTNEVRRAVGLWPGLCAAAEAFDGPMDVLELGASAGLNLSMDRFHYDGGSWHWDSPVAGPRVALSTQWSGPPPRFPAHAAIRHRAACDQKPLNAALPEDRLRLRAYIWPDQPERLERLNAAMEIARSQSITPDAGDAADWIKAKLATRAKDALTVIYHSVFFQYPPQAVRDAITLAIETEGARATPEAPLAWLRFEPGGILGHEQKGASMILELIEWPSGRRRVLADLDPHGRFVHWHGA